MAEEQKESPEQQQARIQVILTGMTKGLKVDDIKKIAADFG